MNSTRPRDPFDIQTRPTRDGKLSKAHTTITITLFINVLAVVIKIHAFIFVSN